MAKTRGFSRKILLLQTLGLFWIAPHVAAADDSHSGWKGWKDSEYADGKNHHHGYKHRWRKRGPKGMSCNALAYLNFDETTITAAEEIPAGDFTPPGSSQTLTDLPAFCRVALTVEPQINIEVWLPADDWNGRYQGVGGGGYAGSISYGALAGAIRGGYATASTDTGHPNTEGGRFALNADGTLNEGLI